jgi:hypothetical protein
MRRDWKATAEDCPHVGGYGSDRCDCPRPIPTPPPQAPGGEADLHLHSWYEDRDFPEIKASNADVLAVVLNPKERKRLIELHNASLATIDSKDRQILALMKAQDARSESLAREAGLREALAVLSSHGCLSGDCPHEHANLCTIRLTEAVDEAAKALSTPPPDALKRLEARVFREVAELVKAKLCDDTSSGMLHGADAAEKLIRAAAARLESSDADGGEG